MQHQGSQAFNTPVASSRCPEKKLILRHEPEFFHVQNHSDNPSMLHCFSLFNQQAPFQLFEICIKITCFAVLSMWPTGYTSKIPQLINYQHSTTHSAVIQGCGS